MSQRALFQMVHWLRRVGGGCEGGSDAELLQRYALSQDEAAFAALLRRHGPLVWRVCRQHLRHEQDAEDAFQATFLVLARKAATIRKSHALASWLFGVARRTALLIYNRTEQPHQARPQPAPGPDPSTAAGSTELCALILEAVRRLPEKYRLPILLCGVQGVTKAEAARQ